MKERLNFNTDWKFYYGQLEAPPKTVRKAAAIGGFTSVLPGEKGEIVPVGAGGHHFLNLISGGNETMGLAMLAGTEFEASLEDWKEVVLPHDWKNELPYTDNPALLMSGSKENGIGYYRKTFYLDESAIGKKISVYFDGVLRCAQVWFNGCFLGEHYSGYTSFSFDLTDLAHYGAEGDNVLLVRVDTTCGAEGWWYDGAGIYRNVYLEIREKIHINQWGLYVATEKLEEGKAQLSINTTVVNDDYHNHRFQLRTILLDGKKEISCVGTGELTVPSLEKQEIKQEIEVYKPELWSVESPHLYLVKVEVIQDGKVIDSEETNFGIRTIAYTKEGLFINGIQTELKGVCEHQDFAGVGSALTKEIVRYKLEKLKEMGANAYRSAHHAASVELLDLCDELGILVMEENRVLESSDLRLGELEEMILRDRNHPSVIFWSLCNEEVIGSTPMAERMARHMAAVVRKLDSKRLIVSAELLNPEGDMNTEYMDIFDVLGVNYPESPIMGDGLNQIHKKYPNQLIMSTENASYFSTRGIYEDNWSKCHTSNYGSCLSMFGKEPLPADAPGAGGTAHPEMVMNFWKTHAFMGGSFIWTAFDYCGEPAPFPWPAISSQFGIMDICGFPKDYFYYYQSQWSEQPMIHAMPHWNWSGKEGLPVEVRVFTNCEEAELILNGKSMGKKMCGEHSTSWIVEYEPGELKIQGFIQNKMIIEKIKHTTKAAISLGMRRVDSDNVKLNVGDTALVEIYAMDENGFEVPDADCEVVVHTSDGMRVLGIGNGNPMDHTSNKDTKRHLFSGKMLVVIQGEIEGLIGKVEATGEGLEMTEMSFDM